MRTIVRAFAICVVLVGATAVSLSSATAHGVTSRQAAAASLPVPLCGPWVPCPPDTPPINGVR